MAAPQTHVIKIESFATGAGAVAGSASGTRTFVLHFGHETNLPAAESGARRVVPQGQMTVLLIDFQLSYRLPGV